MNFGKLLAVGKSMVPTQSEFSYRTSNKVYLPKFESPKNPFAHLPKPAPEKSDAPVRSGIAASQMSRVPLSRPMPVQETAPTPVAAPAPQVAFPRGRWAGKLNPMSIIRPAPVMKSEPPTVQAELSLDAVKVLHNDLTDADVEVVPIKSRPAPPADLPPARKSWEILGERLLKATAL